MARRTETEAGKSGRVQGQRRWAIWRPRSITTILVVTSAALVTLAVGTVLTIGIDTSRRNTLDLLNQKAELIVQNVDLGVADHLDPARDQLAFLAARLADTVEPADKDRVADLLLGALAATPQIAFLGFWDTDLHQVALSVEAEQGSPPKLIRQDHSEDPQILAADAELRGLREAYWGELVFDGDTYINLRQPVWRGDEYRGFLVAAVSVPALSEFVTQVGDLFGGTAFVLHGPDEVLAHPNLTSPHPEQSAENPLVGRTRVGDLVLANLWSAEGLPGFEESQAHGVVAGLVSLGDTSTIVLYRWIDRYGAPWALGAYFPIEDLNAELLRLRNAAIAGLAVLLVAIALAVLLGRLIGRPIQRAATGAALIGEFDLSHVEPLKPSGITELNDQARAFNAMLRALRWFETYVPRALVMRLIGRDERELHSVESELTVMFTDLEGFTARAERLTARETADFLNQHFAMLATCIEAEDGTIDKFIGDSLMAFWGAPDQQTDHALRACRAALAIAEAIEADNAQRQVRGEEPVRLRIGIHTGPVIVGNIGAPGRMNYTVVGDSVNVAQRLEALGHLDQSATTVVLISGVTAAHLLDRLTVTEAGSFEVKGRADPIEVFRLQAPALPPADPDRPA